MHRKERGTAIEVTGHDVIKGRMQLAVRKDVDAIAVSDGPRKAHPVDVRACRRDPADRLVRAVVEDNMDEIADVLACEDRHGPHVHESRAIAVEDDDAPLRLGKGDAKSYHARMAHGADHKKVLVM
jgi:hypothetical protein